MTFLDHSHRGGKGLEEVGMLRVYRKHAVGVDLRDHGR